MLLPPAHESAVPPHLVMNHTKVLHIAKRLQRAESLLNRVYDGVHKQHWAAGESEAEVCQAIRDFLDDHPQKAARIVPPN